MSDTTRFAECGAAKHRLKNLYNEYQDTMDDLLDKQVFSVADADGRENAGKGCMQSLKHAGAIEKTGGERTTPRDDASPYRTHTWRWVDGVREWLQDAVAGRDELPCGHRAHIYHHDDGYGCKYCDERREFDRATVRAVISGD